MGIEHPRLEEFLYPGLLHQFVVKDSIVVQENAIEKDRSLVDVNNS